MICKKGIKTCGQQEKGRFRCFCLPVKAFFFIACWLMLLIQPLTSHATERWRIAVMGEASGTVPANHPAYAKVEREIITLLTNADADTYESALIGIKKPCKTTVCEGESTDDLLARIKTAKKPVDMLLIYSVNLYRQPGKATTTFKITVPMALINLENSLRFFTYDAESRWLSLRGRAAQPSERWLADEAKNTVASAEDHLVLALSEQPRRFLYQLEFQQFVPSHHNKIAKALTELPGFVDGGLTLIDDGVARQELLHKRSNSLMQYRSEVGGAQLRSLVSEVLDTQGYDVDIGYAVDDRKLTVIYTGFPFLGYYISAVLAACLLLYLAYVFTAYRKHDAVIQRYERQKQVREGKTYFNNMRLLAPRKKTWTQLLLAWERSENESADAYRTARRLLDQERFDDAEENVKKALSVNADCEEASKLLPEIQHRREGLAHFRAAQYCWQQDPVNAAHALANARQLYPALGRQLDELESKTQQNLRLNLVKDTLTSAQQALDVSNAYAAIGVVNSTLLSLDGLDGFVTERASLNALKAAAINKINPITRAFVGKGALENVTFFLADAVSVGRSRNSEAQVLGIYFKRISSVGKQCLIERRQDGFYMNHKQSSNGCFVNDTAISPGQGIALKNNDVIAMGGSINPPDRGLAQLICRLGGKNKGSLILKLDASAFSLSDTSSLESLWPGLATDQKKRWVMLGESLAVGLDSLGSLDVGCLSGCDPQLILRFDGELNAEVVPRDDILITVNNEPMVGVVPLSMDSKIKINDCQFGFAAI